ncbi:glycosyltransferase, partial [Litorivivens sp.]|uniref:glycosyltransferase n=1 Tax=Litorivivens sp. TaxID=2020868 RepID=UPI00356A8C7F
MSNSEIILVIASALLAYTYIGYPVLLTLLPKKGVRDVARHRFTPSVTVLVVAHNEAHCIDRKIEDILNLEYDNKNLQIVIGSDGSTDATEAIATRYRDFGVQVVNFSVNRGKPAVINELIPTFTSDIVVLMDSRQSVAKDALQKLVNEFIDPEVGAVSGELMLTSQTADTPALDGVGFYWRYEKYIRLNESRLDSSVGVTGAFYAFRRELFNPIPEST